MARMKELEEENARLKRMYADVQRRHDVLKETLKLVRLSQLLGWPNELFPGVSSIFARLG